MPAVIYHSFNDSLIGHMSISFYDEQGRHVATFENNTVLSQNTFINGGVREVSEPDFNAPAIENSPASVSQQDWDMALLDSYNLAATGGQGDGRYFLVGANCVDYLRLMSAVLHEQTDVSQMFSVNTLAEQYAAHTVGVNGQTYNVDLTGVPPGVNLGTIGDVAAAIGSWGSELINWFTSQFAQAPFAFTGDDVVVTLNRDLGIITFAPNQQIIYYGNDTVGQLSIPYDLVDLGPEFYSILEGGEGRPAAKTVGSAPVVVDHFQ